MLTVAGVLASSASAPLPAAHAADTLTASFAGVPESHDGVSPFSFDLVFSEAVSISYATLRDDSFDVTGATVTGARRIGGRSDLWEITVAPDVATVTDAVADISIELPATLDCDDEGAVCTAGDAKALSNTASATVTAPPPLVAEFEGVPATHDTSTEFSFRLRFSTAVTTSYRILGDTAFDVAGGSVSDARRVDGRSDLWQITVQPDAVTDDTVDDDITITLPATEDCTDTDAVCTAALRPLSEPVTAAVEGPLVEAEQSTEGGQRATRGIPGDKEEEEDRVGVRALPGRPGSLEIQGGNEQVTVSWTAVTSDPAVTAYVLEYRVGDSGPYTMVSRGDVLALSETITGRTNYERFRVQVYAVNDEGTSGTRGTTAMAVPTVPLASANDFATDISGDGTTLWVADTADNKSYAYTKATGAPNGSLDFDYNPAHTHAAGQCLLDGFFWIADSDDDHIYAYNKDTRAHDTTKSFDLHDDNANPRGVACHDGTIWVADSIDHKMYAYGTDGARVVPNSDITLHSSAGVGNGAWTDGTTVWIADTGGRLRAYDVATDAELTNDYGIASTTVAGLSSPSGVWSDGTDLWITDVLDSLFYKFELPQRAANTAPTAANETVTTVENTAYTFDAGDFNFADTDSGDTLEKVKIVTLPDAGTLALSGTAVTVNQEVTKADIDADNLTFTPVVGANGSPYTTFTFKVNDGDDESATAYTMTVNVTAAPSTTTSVPKNWRLKPTGLGVGDQFRLLFVSSTTRSATTSQLSVYDTSIQAYVSSGHAAVRSYSSQFKVLGSSTSGDARDHTDTTFTATDKGVPIYYLGGAKVADDYEDFYDGSWDSHSPTNQLGEDSSANRVWTGTDGDGTVSTRGFGNNSPNSVTLGDPTSSTANWVLNRSFAARNSNYPLYGLSSVFEVSSTAVVAEVASVAVTSTPEAASETYGVGEVIEFTVTFTHPVEVSTNRPHFEFSLDGDTEAAYQGGSGTTALTFAYTVLAADTDDDGIWIGDQSRTIKFDSGEYIHTVGGDDLDAILTHAAPGRQETHKVDGSLTPTVAPGAPTALMADPGDASLAVSWSAPTTGDTPASYAVRHRLTSDADEDASYTTVTRDDATLLAETISGLTNGTGYTVQVNATNTAGTSAWASVTGTPAAPAVPSVPQNLSFVSSNESLVLDWDEVTSDPAVTNYVVQYRVEDTMDWTTWTREVGDALETEETIDGLANYTVYEVQVAARNGDTDEAIGDYATIDRAMPSVNHEAVPGADLWSDGTTYWVLRSNGEAKAYTLASGERQMAKDADFEDQNSDQSKAEGICSDGTTTWVSGDSLDKIYAYEHALDDGTLAYTSDKDIDTGLGSTPAGLWCDEDTLLAVANNGHEVRVYDLPSGVRDSARDIDGLTNANGVWSDGVTIWVEEGNTGSTAISAYSALDGARREWLDIKNLDAAAPTDLRGIWSNGTHMWVADITPHRVFKFPLPQYGDGPPVPRSAEVSANGTTVEVTFTEALAAGVVPAALFEVTVGSGTAPPDSVADISAGDTSVTLTLPDAAGEGVAVTVAYNDLDNDQTDNVVQDAGGADAPSFTKLSATPRAVTAPGAPTALTADPGDASLTVSWTAPTTSGTPVSYAVRYRLTSDADADASYTTVTREVGDALETEETITGLTNGTGYTVQVNATNTAGTSAWVSVTGTPAAATTDVVLVSNIGLDSDVDPRPVQTSETAKGFTTGSHAHDYNLTSVELDVLRTPTSIENLVVQIWSSTTVSGNTVPDDSVITLTNPASLTQGANTFAAPEDSVLDAGTSYFVFVSSDSSHHSLGLYTVTSGNETAADTTGLTGWAILEARIRDRGSDDSWVANTGANFQFRLKGSEAAAGVVPAAPTGVTAAAGNKSLLVGWSAVTAMPRVTGYKIQYRPAGSSDAWTEWTGTIAADATSETVTGLTEWVSYDVQVLAVNRTGDGAWSDPATGTAHRDVTLSAPGSVDGVASDGTTLWTTVPGSNIASAYTLSDGTADTTKNITFATDTAPTGICAHGTRVWVAQSDSTTLQAYDNTDDTRQSAKDVTLPTGTNPVAVFCNDSYLFVAHDDTSGNDDAVLSYKDDLDGSYDRIMDKDVEGLAAAGNANPAGLSIDGDILWVSDSVDNTAYAYSTTTGRRLADMDLDLGSAVGTAAGIWGDTATLWAADADATATEIDSSRRPLADAGAPDVWHAFMENDSSRKMRVLFSEVLDGGVIPASAFTVMAGTEEVAVSSVVHLDTGGGTILKTLVLTLGSDVPAGTTVTVSYTDPNPGSNDATGVVQDLDGDDAPSFSGLRVWSLPGGLPGGVSVVPGDGELEVSWDAAADTGRRPAGTSYQVQYKLSTATEWTTLNRSGDDNPEVSTAPDVVLVSNIGLDSDVDGRTIQTSEAAKGFTTGSHADGYNLTSVELDVLRPPTSIANLVVQIWSSTTVSGNTVPDVPRITLTNPASLTQDANTFAAPVDYVLDAGTSYFVFVSSESSHHALGLYTVTSGNETAADTTGLTGWAILEARIRDRGSDDSWVANTGANFQFRLNGSEAAVVVGQTITGPTNGSQHDVRVRAENDVGDGPYSAVVRATPSAGPLVEVEAGSADNTFKATDNKSGSTTWHYAWIAGTAVCDSTTTFPDMSNYTEGANLTYTATQNTNKACFRSTEGTNSGYAVSDVVNTNAASSDATLSALTLVHGSTSVSLSPSFASGTTEYRAWVANGVSSVTVTATKNDDEASVAISGDTDTSTPNTAVLSLAEGANTVTVTVTAADTTTTGTYTITAVREASAPTADPTALLTEKMTAGQDGTDDIYGYQRVGANYGALTGNEFDFDGTTYTITNLFWNGPDGDATLVVNRLYLCLRSLPENLVYDLWTLRVGSDDYRLPDGQRVGTTYCFRWARDAAWAYGDVVTVKMFGNHEASGAPVVSGTAQVGQTLTASREGIDDLDGKTKADGGELGFAYGYQWIRVDSDGTNPVDISGATSVTYVPVKADVGKKVMVEVSFTDDRSNEEELTSAAYPAAGRILNDVPPMLDTATVNGVSLVLTYDRELDGESDPAVGSYTVTVAGTDVTLTAVDAAGRTVTLTLATAVTSGQSVTLAYRVPTMSPVQDSDGTPAGALDGQAVHNVVGDTTAPTLDSAQVDGDVLVLSYNEALDSGSEPAVGQFDVQVTPSVGSASRRTVSTVDVSGSKVTLTLASAVELDDSVTLSYEKPTSNPLQDVAGNDAAALSGRSVGNAGNNLPMFAQATLTREITENSAANVNVGAVIPAATGGADGATLEYSMEGTDAASFNFNATTRQITTKTGVTYDYENKPSYEVTIKVTDGTDNDTVTVTINVKNLPTISIEPRQERILLSDGIVSFDVSSVPDLEGSGMQVPVVVTQDHAWGDPSAFKSFVQKYDDEATWEVFSELLLPDAPVQGGNFTVTLQSGDDWELDPATTAATTEIVAADPLITVHAEQADYSVSENHGTLTVTLIAETVVAGAPKPLSRTAIITWAAAADSATGGGADFRDAGATELVFIGEDFSEEGGRWVATKEVEVTVVNDNAWEFDEEFHIALSRHVAVPPFRNHTHPLIKLANADGTLCVNNASGVNCGATVTILSNDNTAPVFSNSSETRAVAENSPADTDVGAPVTATDADTGDGDALTYSLEGTDKASFAIDASTGQITTISGVDYDFEADPSYSVTVKATDLQSASVTVAVTINLIDVAVEVDVCATPGLAGREQVWTAEMTVGSSIGVFTSYGFRADSSPFGSLSDDDFRIGTTNYEVGQLFNTAGIAPFGDRLTFLVDNPVPDMGTVLHVCDESFRLADALLDQRLDGESTYIWSNAGLDWSAVDMRNVYLSVTPPQLSSATVDGTQLELEFSRALDTGSVPSNSDFNVQVTPEGGVAAQRSVTDVAISASTATLTLSSAVLPDDTVTVQYSGRALRDTTAIKVRAFDDFEQVDNDTPDTTAPLLESNTVSGSTLTLTYNEALDEGSVPAPSAFVVNVAPTGGTAQRRNVTAVVVDGVIVRLTLVSPVAPGDTVTLVYTVPGSNPVQDQSGNDAAAIDITIELLADQTGRCNRDLQDRGLCDLGTATTLAPGVPLEAAVAKNNDVDWFRVELVEDKVYRIDMEGAPTGRGTLRDPYLRGMFAVFTGSDVLGHQADGRLDGGGEDIETIWYSLHGDCAAGERSPSTDCELFDEGTYYNDDGGVGYNARLYLRDFPTGAHYLEARGLGPATGTYTITLTEVTDDAEGARTLDLSTQTSAVIDFPGDTDAFTVDLIAATEYTITLRSQGWDGWSRIDIDTAHHNSAPGIRVVTPYDGSTGTYTITPATTGTHTLRIVGRNWGRHQRFATGDYTITITG